MFQRIAHAGPESVGDFIDARPPLDNVILEGPCRNLTAIPEVRDDPPRDRLGLQVGLRSRQRFNEQIVQTPEELVHELCRDRVRPQPCLMAAAALAETSRRRLEAEDSLRCPTKLRDGLPRICAPFLPEGQHSPELVVREILNTTPEFIIGERRDGPDWRTVDGALHPNRSPKLRRRQVVDRYRLLELCFFGLPHTLRHQDLVSPLPGLFSHGWVGQCPWIEKASAVVDGETGEVMPDNGEPPR